MAEEIFYCERPKCSVHNKKTQDLAYIRKYESKETEQENGEQD